MLNKWPELFVFIANDLFFKHSDVKKPKQTEKRLTGGTDSL